MNLVPAAINLASAIYWVAMGQPQGVVISLIGAYCSIKAYRWAREF